MLYDIVKNRIYTPQVDKIFLLEKNNLSIKLLESFYQRLENNNNNNNNTKGFNISSVLVKF